MTLRPSDLIKRGTLAWRGGRSSTSKSAHESENLSLFAVFPCHMPPRQILTIQGKVRKTRQLQSFPKHDVNARSNRFYCIMFGSCSIWRREFPAPWSLAQKSRYQFFTSQKNKLSSQNFVAPRASTIMNHSGRVECSEHGNHVPIRHKTEHVVIHKTKAKEFPFYTLLTSSSQNSRNFRRRSLARRTHHRHFIWDLFYYEKVKFFLPFAAFPQMDGS